MQTMFDPLDVIERFEYEGQRAYCGEITDKQRKMFECFGAAAPNTL
jgi:hypothetical protein